MTPSEVLEYHAPGAVDVPPDDNALALLHARARLHPRRPVLAHREGDRFVPVAGSDVVRTVRGLAAGLVGLGLAPGARVAVLSATRIELCYLDYAAWSAGLATVPIYESDAEEQIEWILRTSGAEVLVVEDAALRARFAAVADRVPHVRTVLTIADGDLHRLSRDDELLAEVDRRAGAIRHDDVATIVYTSGTTGRPKGCVITHGNVIWEVRQTLAAAGDLFDIERSSTLMFLPLAHILARVVMVTCISGGMVVGFSTGLDRLAEELRLFQPTSLIVVPRVIEKLLAAVRREAGSGVRARLLERALDVAERASRAREAGGAPVPLRLEHALHERLVYRRIRAGVGGRLTHCISGGAPLDERLAHVFRGAGIEVLEGYGLTETTAAATVNRPGASRPGTVGPPIPGAAVRIGPSSEVQLRGGFVFAGYLDDPDATAEVTTADGWLRTGDQGSIDPDGSLRITGRIKELIVTAGGKNVVPTVLEERIVRHPLVSQAVVVGDRRPFVAALVALDPDALAGWAAARGKAGRTAAELADDPELHTELHLAVDRANEVVSRAESVREFRVLPAELSVEAGELTPTLKLKRRVVADRYADAIAAIYGDRPGPGPGG